METNQKTLNYENYYDALNSIEFSKLTNRKLEKFNTEALIEILSSLDDVKWIEGAISRALEEKEEGKQIYNLAEIIRTDYIEYTIGDLTTLCENLKEIPEDKKLNVNPIVDYLHHCIYSIDLYEVAKELITRYKNNSLKKIK